MEETRIAPLPGQAQLPGIEPEIPPTRSKSLATAWKKGRDAALSGRSMADCPYPDRRARGRVTYSRAWRKWWHDGFQSVGLFPGSGR